MTTWNDWLFQNSGADFEPSDELRKQIANKLGKQWQDRHFDPTTEDRAAAWRLYIQLRSRITSQELPYLDGDEAAAVDSIHKLFDFTREACNADGAKSARFSELAWAVMDLFVRDLTAKWHKPILENRLTVDLAHELRTDLQQLRIGMTFAMRLFESLASGDPIRQPSIPGPSTDEPSDDANIPFDRILFSQGVHGGQALLDAEREAIAQRRRDAGQADTTSDHLSNLAGVAISGGGLRSATFALGALQALANHRLLKDFDYLSTVSGGGYAGSFLSCYLNVDDGEFGDGNRVGLTGEHLPFARQDASESGALRHLRSSGQSLLAGSTWRVLEMIVLAITGWVASLLVALPPLLLLASLVAVSNSAVIAKAIHDPSENPYTNSNSYWLPIAWGVSGLLLVSFVWLAYWHRIQRRSNEDRHVLLPSKLIAWTGGLLILTGFVWLVYGFPHTLRLRALDSSLDRFQGMPDWLVTVLASLAVPVFGHFASRFRTSKSFGGLFAILARGVMPAFVIWGALSLICRHVIFRDPTATFWDELAVIAGLCLAAGVVAALTWNFLDINDCSLHPFYRDRLSRAYHLRLQKQDHGGLTLASGFPTKLSELRKNNTAGPFHLINTALNANGSDGENEKLRGRQADFFLFSQTFCGSEATGYAPTKDFETANRRLDLATAIAASGAAVSPIMGVKPNRYGFWLALLNLRLDYWLQNPLVCKQEGRFPQFHYWLRQYLGMVKPDAPFINVSDGGHIENIGLYELLRRRCRYIVVIDGECDPGITCSSFLQAMRYAKIDFGIDINIDLSRLKFGGQARKEPKQEESPKRAKQTVPDSPIVDYHFAMGKVIYPPTDSERQEDVGLSHGLVLYLKSSITSNEAPSIQSYRDRNPSFPHQSTADLAYDEEQFECYRALGEHIVDDVVRDELMANGPPKSVEEWFQSLERNLLR
ncbi:MAG: patatin-like phospholipase family protein [Planctomycetota bacterium]